MLIICIMYLNVQFTFYTRSICSWFCSLTILFGGLQLSLVSMFINDLLSL